MPHIKTYLIIVSLPRGVIYDLVHKYQFETLGERGRAMKSRRREARQSAIVNTHSATYVSRPYYVFLQLRPQSSGYLPSTVQSPEFQSKYDEVCRRVITYQDTYNQYNYNISSVLTSIMSRTAVMSFTCAVIF
jgi:hypothetical protein